MEYTLKLVVFSFILFGIMGCGDDDPNPKLENEIAFPNYPFISNYFELSSGENLHYIDEGQGQALFLFHGAPMSAYEWRNVIEPLSQHYRVIAYDFLNYGKSDKNLDIYDYNTHAGHLEELMDGLNIQEAIFIGHDIGGPIAGVFAAKNPQRVKGFVLFESAIGPFPSKSLMPSFFANLFGPNAETLVLDDNYFVETLLLKNQFNNAEPPAPEAILTFDNFTDEEAEIFRAPYLSREDRIPLLNNVHKALGFLDEPGDALSIWSSYAQYLTTTDIPRLVMFGNPSFIMAPDFPAINPLTGQVVSDPSNGNPVTFRNIVTGQISSAFGAWQNTDNVSVYDMNAPTIHFWLEEDESVTEEWLIKVQSWLSNNF